MTELVTVATIASAGPSTLGRRQSYESAVAVNNM